MVAVKPKPTVRVKPASYQPTKAELEEDVRIPASSPENLAKAMLRHVNVEKVG